MTPLSSYKAIDRLRLLAGQDASGIGLPLRVDSAGRLEVVSYRTVHAARVYNNASLSHATSGAWQPVTFNSEAFDDDGMHDLVTQTDRLTILQAGTYFLGAQIHFANHGTGQRAIKILVNGSTIIAYREEVPSASYHTALYASTLYALAAGDFLTVEAYQTSGGALDILYAAEYTPVFWAVMV
jgi:hypothetical protein